MTTCLIYDIDSERKTSPDFTFLSFLGEIPYLTVSPINAIIDYGNRIELFCQTNIIHPYDIQWLHNGQLITNQISIKYLYDRSILDIEKAIDEHTGIYQCFSNYSFNQQVISSMPTTLTVRREYYENVNENYSHEFFSFLAHPSSQNQAIVAGHRLILSCEVDPGFDEHFLGTIEWYHNGSPIKFDSTNRNRIDYHNGTLTIDQTSVKEKEMKTSMFVSLLCMNF